MNTGGKFYDLHIPNLSDVREKLLSHMKQYFDVVSCKLSESPDFTQPPFNMTARGICGDVTMVVVGGVKEIIPSPNLELKCNVRNIVKLYGQETAFVCGAAAGPFYEVGSNCEFVPDLYYEKGELTRNRSKISYLEKEEPRTINADSDKFAILGEFLCSKGQPGQVIHLNLKGRIKDGSVIHFLQQFLAKEFGSLDKPVGFGGLIHMKQGRAKLHIMSGFSKTPLITTEQIEDWLKYFNVDASFVGTGVVLSHDPENLDIRLEHFHGYSSKTDIAGHFRWDTSPDQAEYDVYLVITSKLMKQ